MKVVSTKGNDDRIWNDQKKIVRHELDIINEMINSKTQNGYHLIRYNK